MPKISRRAARARGGKVVSADAHLLEFEKRLEEARQIPVETDEEVDEKSGKMLGFENLIATVPAEGPIGVAVKLRLAVSIFKQMRPDELNLPEIAGVQSALETVERLAAQNAG